GATIASPARRGRRVARASTRDGAGRRARVRHVRRSGGGALVAGARPGIGQGAARLRMAPTTSTFTGTPSTSVGSVLSSFTAEARLTLMPYSSPIRVRPTPTTLPSFENI